MTTRQELLVDVRSPAEFATGALTSSIAPTVNIEYHKIAQLPTIYAERHGITVTKHDTSITLYCRSGRRSYIALQTLREMGYVRVRDIGGLDAARAVLHREEIVSVRRRWEAHVMSAGGMGVEDDDDAQRRVGSGDAGECARAKGFGALVEGLKGLGE